MPLQRGRMASEGIHHPAWQRAAQSLGLDWYTPAPYLDIEVQGETGFLVARRVWQGAVYARLLSGEHPRNLRAWLRWLHSEVQLRKEYPALKRHQELLSFGERADNPWAALALVQYFKELVSRGLVPDGLAQRCE